MGGISIWQIIIILLVIVILFGMGKLPKIAAELGKALKVFRSSVDTEERTHNGGKNRKTAKSSKSSTKSAKVSKVSKSAKVSATRKTSKAKKK